MTKPYLTALAAAVSAIVVTGCANVQPDTTPKNPTVVLASTTYLNGRYLPELSTTQTVHTRGDRRRIDTDAKFSSLMMRLFNGNTTLITRVDRNLIWHINNKNKTYMECPLTGCIEDGFWDKFSEGQDEDDEEYESYEELGCEVTLTTNDFSVKKTGQQRMLSDIQTEEYRVDWKIELQDKWGKTDTNLVSMVFWTATPDGELSNAWKVHREFNENFMGQREGQNDPLLRLLGQKPYMAVSALTGDIERTHAESYGGFLSELNTIKGYPLSTKLEWLRRDNACETERARGKNNDLDLANGLEGAAKSLVTGFLSQQGQKIMNEWQKKPLVTYIYEVKHVKEEMVNDSVFDVPMGYKMVDRQ